MDRRTDEQLFLRYRDHGDAEALASVFDRTAPTLLLLAMHMVRDADLAEDLVQTTFLTAIEDAPSYRTGTPFLSWLARILGNRARAEKRAARRRADVPGKLGLRPGSGISPENREPDPLQATSEEEVLAHVTRALEHLAEPYRTVLVLRLVHGLQATEIGHSLGRAPNTVRVQLRRGLEMLRQGLPRTLVVPAALLATSEVTLAAVRKVVLAKAKEQAVAVSASGAVTSTLIVGAGVMGKWSVGLVCAALVLVFGTLMVFPLNETPADGGSVPTNTTRDHSLTDRNTDKQQAPTDVRTPVEAGRAAARSTRSVLWRGQVVDGQGRAVPNRYLRIRPVGAQRPAMRLGSSFYADANGEFARSIVEGTWSITVAGCVVVSPDPLEIARTEPDEVSTTIVVREVPRRWSIRGQVLDDSGTPLIGVEVEAIGSRLPCKGRSDSNGVFEVFSGCEDCEEASLQVREGEARRQGVPREDPCSICVHEEYIAKDTVPWGTDGVVIHLTEGHELVVRAIREQDGRPVEDFVAQCFRRMESRSVRSVRARGSKAGEATFRRASRGSNVLVVMPEQNDLAPYVGRHVLNGTPGETITVRLERLSRTTIKVVDGVGEPVAGTHVQVVESNRVYEVRWDKAFHHADMFKRSWGTPYLCGEGCTNEKGMAEVPGRPRLSGCWVRVLGPGHGPKMVEADGARWNGSVLEIEVDRGHVVEGRLVGLDPGELRQGKYGIQLRRSAENYRKDPFYWPPRAGFTEPFVLSENGLFRIEHVPEDTWCVLLAEQNANGRFDLNPKELAVVHVPRDVSRPLELRASIASVCTVTGRIVGWSELDEGRVVLLCQNTHLGGVTSIGRVLESSISDSGRYSIEDVPPVRYQLYLYLEPRVAGRVVHLTYLLAEGVLESRSKLSHDFVMPRNKLTVRARHKKTKVPVSGRRVQLVDQQGLVTCEAITDVSGVACFVAIAKGRYTIYVLPRDWNRLRWGGSRKTMEKHRVKVAEREVREEDEVVWLDLDD